MGEIGKPFAAIWGPLFVSGHSPLPTRGQACCVPDWTRYCHEPMNPADFERFSRSAIAYNVSVALGHRGLVAIDRDTDERAIVEALRDVFRAIYERGGIPVAKFGSKGLTSFFRWTDAAPFRNRTLTSPAFGVMIELSGAGRSTTLPPSIHPKTGKPYTWRTARTLCDTRVDELPALTAADVEAIETAMSPFMPPPKEPTAIRPRVSASELSERERTRHERYALTILARETAALAAMQPDSGRNRKAFDLACRVGRYVHHDILAPHAVVDPIVRACEANGLVQEGRAAVLKTITSGLRKAAGDALPDLRASTQGGR
jgi:hypothetical protein